MTAATGVGFAIHTSSPELGLAIATGAEPPRCQTWALGYALSSQLHQHLQDFLAPYTWRDLDWLAVARGPGGFTGTRLGVVTARTLAQQLDIPVFAISSLAAVAWAERDTVPTGGAIALTMQAQRSMVFGAVYQPTVAGLVCRVPETVVAPADWPQVLAQAPIIPDHTVTVAGDLGRYAEAVLALARQDWQQGKRPHWSEALPFYGQHPVAGMGDR